MRFTEENNKERLEFIDRWSDFVRDNDDMVWSKQQNVIIDSCIKSNKMTKEEYIRMKNEF